MAIFRLDTNQSQTVFQFDPLSFNHYVHTNRFSLTRYALRILNDTYMIENIVQDAFLKLWDFRETITSAEHAENFLKQAVRWECYSFFRSPTSRFHRKMVRLDDLGSCDSIFIVDSKSANLELTEESVIDKQLQEVSKAIANFFYGKEKELIELHFIKGLTHKQIASRYGLSIRTVTLILNKGKLRLKTVLVTAPERLKNAVAKKQLSNDLPFCYQFVGLNKEQNNIYQLRISGKHSFGQIAAILQLPVAYIQTEYVKAWKILRSDKTQKGGKIKANKFNKSANLLSA